MTRWKVRAAASGCLLLWSSIVRAQDSTVRRVPLFTHNDAFLALGFVLATVALAPSDERIARRLQEPDAQENRFLQNIATDVRLIASPGSIVIGGVLYATGRVTHHERLADLGLHGLEAIAVGSGVNYFIKGVAGRARPYVVGDTNPRDYEAFRGFRKGRDYASLPSGHTLAAFSAAAAVTYEAGRWHRGAEWIVGPVLYTGAAMVGMSRLYNNQHWASDVILAAGIGTFAGNKVVRYNHRVRPQNKLDRVLLSLSIQPGRDGVQIGASLATR